MSLIDRESLALIGRTDLGSFSLESTVWTPTVGSIERTLDSVQIQQS